MSRKEIEDISVELITETERAILVTDDGRKRRAWLPKSQIEYEKQTDGTYIVTGPVWLLRDKELI